MSGPGDDPFARVALLVREIEAWPDPTFREPARAVVRAVLELHALGLSRMLTTITAAAPGTDIVRALVEDDVVASLLLLHGLHPLGVVERIRRVLAELGEELDRYGAEIEIAAASEDAVRLILIHRRRGGSGAQSATLRAAIENATLSAAPDAEVFLEERCEERPAPLIPVENLLGARAAPVGSR